MGMTDPSNEKKEFCCYCIKGRVAAWWKKNAKTDNTWFMVACVVFGIGIGFIVNAMVEPGSVHGKRWAFWLGFPGSMFLRAIKCLVVPLIFCSMVAGVADLAAHSKTGNVGKQSIVLYLFTTVCASIEGVVWILIFKSTFVVLKVTAPVTGAAISLGCPEGGFVTASTVSGTLTCAAGAGSTFMLNNPDSKISIQGSLPSKTVEDTIAEIFYSLVPTNFFASCLNGDILAVITFAIFFGIVASTLPGTQNRLVLDFFVQLSHVFQSMITMVVSFAPFAVASLIIGALALQEDLGSLLVNVGMFTLSCTLGFICHVLLVMTPLFYYYVGEFPLKYAKQMGPAYAFAFSCASSASTLPLTMKCVDRTRQVSLGLRKFILTLGATVNMDGGAIYFPCAIIFLAVTGGYSDKVDVKAYLLCIIASTLGSIGASPIPNSGLVMLITIWETVFPGIPIPPQLAYVQAIDFFIDRMVTVMNVLGDTFVARIVQAMQGPITEEELRLLDEENALSGTNADNKEKSLASADSAGFSNHDAL